MNQWRHWCEERIEENRKKTKVNEAKQNIYWTNSRTLLYTAAFIERTLFHIELSTAWFNLFITGIKTATKSLTWLVQEEKKLFTALLSLFSSSKHQRLLLAHWKSEIIVSSQSKVIILFTFSHLFCPLFSLLFRHCNYLFIADISYFWRAAFYFLKHEIHSDDNQKDGYRWFGLWVSIFIQNHSVY